MNSIKEALDASKHERDTIKAQMYDATKRLLELEGIIISLKYALDQLQKESTNE